MQYQSTLAVLRLLLRRKLMGVQSHMIQGILRGELFCTRSDKQVPIGSDEYRGREMVRLDCLSRHYGSGQLHSIVAPESIALGQLYGAIDDQTIYWEQQKVVHTVLQEATQDPFPLQWRGPPGAAVLPPERLPPATRVISTKSRIVCCAEAL